MPALIPILGTIGASLVSTLMTKLLTGPVIIKIFLKLAKYIVEKTPNNFDNELYEIVDQAINGEQEE